MRRRPRSCWSGASLLAALVAVPVAAAPQPGSAAAAAELQEAIVSVSVNGVPGGEPVTLLKGPGDQFYAPAELLASWRLGHRSAPAFTRDGVHYHLLNAIPGLRLEFDQATQELTVVARPDTFERTRLSYTAL